MSPKVVKPVCFTKSGSCEFFRIPEVAIRITTLEKIPETTIG
jgi:hypothetical protein